MGGDDGDNGGNEGIGGSVTSMNQRRGRKYHPDPNRLKQGAITKEIQLLCDELHSFGLSDFMLQSTKLKESKECKDPKNRKKKEAEQPNDQKKEQKRMEKESVDFQLRSFLEKTAPL